MYSPPHTSDTVLLLQGTEDKVVPPNQAELMHRALLAKGIPTALKMYPGQYMHM
jgi:dipeptidyl aminopeptidase/acylaminoacyl peptidase